MLAKKHRIPRANFGLLKQNKGILHSKHFSLRGVSADEVRMAVSVSKKVSKSAVVRNRVRRRAYTALRPLIPHMSKGLYLFIAKPESVEVRGEVLARELAELVKKI